MLFDPKKARLQEGGWGWKIGSVKGSEPRGTRGTAVIIKSGPNMFWRACVHLLLDMPSFLIDKKLYILSRPAGADKALDKPDVSMPEKKEEEEDGSPVPVPSNSTPQDEGGSNNILAYVSVLAAVVLGSLVYVVYKWWVFAFMSCNIERRIGEGTHAYLNCFHGLFSVGCRANRRRLSPRPVWQSWQLLQKEKSSKATVVFFWTPTACRTTSLAKVRQTYISLQTTYYPDFNTMTANVKFLMYFSLRSYSKCVSETSTSQKMLILYLKPNVSNPILVFCPLIENTNYRL